VNSEFVVGIVSVAIAVVGIALAAVQVRRTPRLMDSATSPQLRGPGHRRSGAAEILIGDIPREPLSYTHRQLPLSELEQSLNSSGLCLLLGGRGVGKTHLAAAYAREYLRAGGRVVIWIVAEEATAVITSLAELARRAGIADETVDVELIAKSALHWLERSAEPALVVLDNAMDPDLVAPWLPQRGLARVVVTSTNQDFAILGAPVQVGVFTEAQAVTFLCARAGRLADIDANLLARELGLLPLALAQAGWVIRRRALSFADYLTELRTGQLQSLLTHVPGEGYPHSLEEATTWSITEVEKDDPTGMVHGILEFLAVLSAAGVRRELLHLLMPNPVEVDAAIGALAAASLIEFDLSGSAVTMHRLTQRVVLSKIRRNGRLRDVTAAAVTALARTVDETPNPLTDVPIDVVDHVTQLWSRMHPILANDPADSEPLTTLRRLLRWSVARLTAAGELSRVLSLNIGIFAGHTSLLPTSHEFVLEGRKALQNTHLSAPLLDEYFELAEQTLADHIRLFGQDDARTIAARNIVGYGCEIAGRLDRATELHSLNLAESTRVLGPDHELTLMARTNVAGCYRTAGLLDRAIEVFEENLQEHVRVHGEDHPATVNARGELARSYVRAGQIDAGVALHEKNAVLLNRKEHAESLWWTQYRAVAYSAAGRHDDAIQLLQELQQSTNKRLPSDHPQTIRLRLFLARALLAAGHDDEATNLFERTVLDRQRVLGPDHPATLNARQNLGLALAHTGKTRRAREILTVVVADYQRVLSTDHPYTRQARDTLNALS
jgi:tetratricopeptide (TPR) repeat protein